MAGKDWHSFMYFEHTSQRGHTWHCVRGAESHKGDKPYKRAKHMRTSFATLAISEKVMDVMALSRILGHRDASMTLNVYADALEESRRNGMDYNDEMIFGSGLNEKSVPSVPNICARLKMRNTV